MSVEDRRLLDESRFEMEQQQFESYKRSHKVTGWLSMANVLTIIGGAYLVIVFMKDTEADVKIHSVEIVSIRAQQAQDRALADRDRAEIMAYLAAMNSKLDKLNER